MQSDFNFHFKLWKSWKLSQKSSVMLSYFHNILHSVLDICKLTVPNRHIQGNSLVSSTRLPAINSIFMYRRPSNVATTHLSPIETASGRIRCWQWSSPAWSELSGDQVISNDLWPTGSTHLTYHFFSLRGISKENFYMNKPTTSDNLRHGWQSSRPFLQPCYNVSSPIWSAAPSCEWTSNGATFLHLMWCYTVSQRLGRAQADSDHHRRKNNDFITTSRWLLAKDHPVYSQGSIPTPDRAQKYKMTFLSSYKEHVEYLYIRQEAVSVTVSLKALTKIHHKCCYSEEPEHRHPLYTITRAQRSPRKQSADIFSVSKKRKEKKMQRIYRPGGESSNVTKSSCMCCLKLDRLYTVCLAGIRLQTVWGMLTKKEVTDPLLESGDLQTKLYPNTRWALGPDSLRQTQYIDKSAESSARKVNGFLNERLGFDS